MSQFQITIKQINVCDMIILFGHVLFMYTFYYIIIEEMIKWARNIISYFLIQILEVITIHIQILSFIDYIAIAWVLLKVIYGKISSRHTYQNKWLRFIPTIIMHAFTCAITFCSKICVNCLRLGYNDRLTTKNILVPQSLSNCKMTYKQPHNNITNTSW